MSGTENVETTNVDYSTYFTGRVKWFNNKSGYGFITVIKNGTEFPEGVTSFIDEDIFAHHSFVFVDKEQFRYLVQGEYVNFKVSKIDSESHKYQATDICGVSGGKLLCETRDEQRSIRPQATKGRGPRDGTDGEWSETTQKKRNYKQKSSNNNQEER
jgi:cold shock CspA family protein